MPNSILQDKLQELKIKTRNSLNQAEKVLKRRVASGNAIANIIIIIIINEKESTQLINETKEYQSYQ